MWACVCTLFTVHSTVMDLSLSMTAHMRKSAKGDGRSKMENEVKTTMMMMMMKVVS